MPPLMCTSHANNPTCLHNYCCYYCHCSRYPIGRGYFGVKKQSPGPMWWLYWPSKDDNVYSECSFTKLLFWENGHRQLCFSHGVEWCIMKGPTSFLHAERAYHTNTNSLFFFRLSQRTCVGSQWPYFQSFGLRIPELK